MDSASPPPVRWNRTYGQPHGKGDGCSSVVQTVDGGYALAARTYGAGSNDVLLVKTNSSGHKEWSQQYVRSCLEWTWSIVQTSDGGYAIAGYTSTPALYSDFFLIKTNSSGHMEWNKTYGGSLSDEAMSLIQTSDGGFALAGYTDSYGAGSSDFWLVKTNATGDLEWSKTYGGGSNDKAYIVMQTSDGGYALAGETMSLDAWPHYGDFWLVKTDASGNEQWNMTYGGHWGEFSRSMVQTGDGGYALTGITQAGGTNDFWLVKTDASGNEQWNRTFGRAAADDFAESLIETADGYLLSGYYIIDLVGGDLDSWSVKTDHAGNMRWNLTLGGTGDDRTYSVIESADGGYVLGGLTNSFEDADGDCWLVKLGGVSGITLSAWAYGTPIIDGVIVPSVTIPVFDGSWGGSWGDVTFPGEWDDATQIDFTLSLDGEVCNATLYVKNDYINLYLAFRIRGQTYHDSDLLEITFDNNDNGVRDLGENVLRTWGDGRFVDLYVQNTSSGLLQEDWVSAGVTDGVGASYFEDGTYSFEIAFPLNTSDDANDFSLSVGSTVGFNVAFHDNNTGQIDTWPSPQWTDMTHIYVEASPNPPSPTCDLQIIRVEVTQAIQFLNNSLPLVRGKLTAVRVYVSTGSATGPVSVRVHLYGVDGGRVVGALRRSFDAPQAISRGNQIHTANFVLPMGWVTRQNLTLRAFVQSVSSILGETKYDNNWMVNERLTFGQTLTPTIYIVPINIGTPLIPVTVDDDEIAQQEEYLRTVYPLADVNFTRLPWQLLGVWSNFNFTANRSSLISKLTEVGYALGLSDGEIDQIYGFTPSGGGISNPQWNGGHGVAACGYRGTSREGTLAHELNHNLGNNTWGRHAPGGGAGGPDPSWPYVDDTIQEFGVDLSVSPMRIVGADTPDFMSYNRSDVLPTKWISPYRWEHLFHRLLTPNSTSPSPLTTYGEILIISGWVTQSGTGSLDPIFTLPGDRESSVVPGNFSLILQNSEDETLLVKSFEAEFEDVHGGVVDPYYFTIAMSHVNGTSKILLMYNNVTVLDTRQTSLNAPTVTVLSPNGGEVWNSSLQTVQWTGQDLDGDPLTYRIYFSPDNGSTWTPISPRINYTLYQVDGSVIQGSNTSLICIVASDGFLVSQNTSLGVFTVLDKPPTATILSPQADSSFLTDDTIILRGRGYDPEDRTLPAAAYNWTSNMDGYLGEGSTLTTTLTLGAHLITLTVTDDIEQTAHDHLNVTVTLDVQIASVIPYKTAVGQGYVTDLNVTVKNFGYTTHNVNITVNVVNSTQTVVITTPTNMSLTPGTSATLTAIWNTTGFAKGEYNLTATALLLDQNVTQTLLSNKEICVTIPGDIDCDRDVDIFDIVEMASAYGVEKPDPQYDARFDIDDDGDIDIFDIVLAAGNYGKSW